MTDPLIERLARVDSCALSDALDSLGIDGILEGLAPLSARQRIAGRAVTVRLGPDDGAASKRHLCTAAVEASGAGDILLIQNDGRTNVAGWGGILTLAASLRNIGGVIIDGACRDVDEAVDLGFPIYGLAGTSRTARGRIVELGWDTPIEVRGKVAHPGDLILADSSGVVLVPAARAGEVLDIAEAIVRKEGLMADAVRAGRPVSGVMGKSYEDMLKELGE